MSARHVDTEAFEREVLPSDRPTLVDFYADWCGPCRTMAPVLDDLASDWQGRAHVVQVNVDESPELAGRYGVEAVPTFIVLRDGRAAHKLVGVQTRQALEAAMAG
jgi:thioredoxin 1